MPPLSSKNMTPLRIFFLSIILVLYPLGMMGQKKSFAIDTRPTGVLVFLNGTEVGTTPFVYKYDKTPTTSTTIELRKEGWVARSVDMVMILKDQQAAKRPLMVNLYREGSTDGQRTDLPIVTLTKTIDPNTDVFGKIGSKKLTKDSRELIDLNYPDQLTSDIMGAIRNSFAQMHQVRKGTQKGDEEIRRAKVYLLPVLKDVHMDLVEFDHRYYGNVDLSLEWRFLSGIDTDSVIFSIEKRTTWSAFMEPPSSVLNGAIRDAAHQMIDEEGLQARLSKVFNDGLVRSKGSVVEIVRPSPIVFSGRKDMLASLVKAVVTVKTKEGHGSGFLIASDGYIITNAHVVGDQSTVSIKFNQGFTLDGQVVKVNRDFDLALIKTPGSDLPALTLGDDAQLLIGEELFAIGTPLDEQLGQTVTRGIMSGKREFEGRTFLQTDVSINPGNSGGPLIDEAGKVVGVATLKVQETGVQGIGFAVPVGKMLEMLNISMVAR
ncbi:MAG: trypsin-like peptidase domain-containing protein [Flavobacteriales bacterium]|nr:trypsin-like peptidase domain-containing protein [Flavobacteriales bacterium]